MIFSIYSLKLKFLVLASRACSMEKVRTCQNRMFKISSGKVMKSPCCDKLQNDTASKSAIWRIMLRIFAIIGCSLSLGEMPTSHI